MFGKNVGDEEKEEEEKVGRKHAEEYWDKKKKGRDG